MFKRQYRRIYCLLLKYNLWTRNDHRCKFILCTFFFLNKNMYIFIWGESSIKMSEPGEYCHTHSTHTHTLAYTKEPQWEIAGETNSYQCSGKLELGWPEPEPLWWPGTAAEWEHWQPAVLSASKLALSEEGEITPLTQRVFSSPRSSN